MMGRALTHLIAAGFCLASAMALAAGELVVISVTGLVPDVQEGQTILPQSPIRVPPASTVRLLSASGKVIAIQGPYSGPALAQAEAKSATDGSPGVAKLAKFLTERQMAGGALGTMRSAAAPNKAREPQDPWMVAIEDSGAQCARPQKVDLWRKEARATETLLLRSAGGAQAKLSWMAGDNSQELGREFVSDGQSFQAALGSRTSAITLHLLPPSLANPVDIAAWLIEQGCRRQAELYLDKLP